MTLLQYVLIVIIYESLLLTKISTQYHLWLLRNKGGGGSGTGRQLDLQIGLRVANDDVIKKITPIIDVILAQFWRHYALCNE